LTFEAAGVGLVGLVPTDRLPEARWTNTWPEEADDDA
jgi:hypothetical protein